MSERNRKPYESVLDTIGWTPLIRLQRVNRGIRTPIFAKAEFFNPGGSIKDRIGLPIIEHGLWSNSPHRKSRARSFGADLTTLMW